MTNPTAAILIIGDEILSGRTREGNAYWLAGELLTAGITLAEIRVIPDDHATIVSAVRELSARNDTLFTSGGIGPTHDDITADAVADAFGRSIDVREDARDFGIFLSAVSVGLMGVAIGWLAASLLFGAIIYYAVIYTIWLKPRTPQNIVIGGGAGALPPLLRWVAVTRDITAIPI